MTAPYLRRFVSPPLYVQGPGALNELPQIVAGLGERPLVITDPDVKRLLQQRLHALLQPDLAVVCLSGEITDSAIAGLVEEARARPPDIVLGVGGGRALDAGKAVAKHLKSRYISVPTIASNDAPTSRAIAHYDDLDGRFKVGTLGRNPDAVVVDTEIIARAPAKFLRWGIGDALAKGAEASACARSAAARTLLDARPNAAGLALAQAAHDVLRCHAPAALAVAGSGNTNAAFEATVEAVILLSGLGFENGGLCIAHAMTRGLMLAPRTRASAHGEQVAYGLLIQLALDGDDRALAAERDFVHSIGLPVRLGDFAPGVVEPDEYEFLAEKAMTAVQHIRNYPRQLDVVDIVDAIERVEQLANNATAPRTHLLVGDIP